MKINDFEGLCLTNAHLAFRPKGFQRRFAPQNDNGYAFTLLHMCILPHLRITTNGNYHNTILPLRFEDKNRRIYPIMTPPPPQLLVAGVEYVTAHPPDPASAVATQDVVSC